MVKKLNYITTYNKVFWIMKIKLSHFTNFVDLFYYYVYSSIQFTVFHVRRNFTNSSIFYIDVIIYRILDFWYSSNQTFTFWFTNEYFSECRFNWWVWISVDLKRNMNRPMRNVKHFRDTNHCALASAKSCNEWVYVAYW